MQRRYYPFRVSVLFCLALFLWNCQSKKAAKRDRNAPITLSDEVSITELQHGYETHAYSVTQVVDFYLKRIDSIDAKGPELNAVLTVNPDARAIAAELDSLFAVGAATGPLFGVPILLKDNIDTGDKMPCTAGANLMAESYPAEDSPLAAELRDAGAVILGKTNLSEWANFHSSSSSSGWSALGGQTRNPYILNRNPCGSSAGSGVAVAANLCVVAIGTETNGSIICPSNNNGIVGIKPTVGLVSRTGIIPISNTQDTGGPMARSVRDAAMVLGALSSVDPKDDQTHAPGRIIHHDYTPFLKEDGLQGKRIGYYTAPLADEDKDPTTVELEKTMKQALEDMRAQGAEIIDVNEIIAEDIEEASFTVLLYEFKDGLNTYLRHMDERAPVKDLAEIIEKTLADSVEMKYHDHELLKMAQAKGGLEEKEYQQALAKILKGSREKGIDRVMNELKLDAIVAPSGSPAWVTSLENGDTFGVFSSSPAAIAGYPSITVPMGKIDGLPVGMSIFGRAWSESLLLEIAYAYEQATHHRFTPRYSPE